MRFAVLLALSVIIVAFVQGADSERVKLGDTKPLWRDLPGVDGQKHSLSDLNDKQIVVVVITCNHCPVALEYFERLNAFARQHCAQGGKVALVAVSLSDQETDKLPRMKELSDRNGFQFPYLRDESQRIGKALGATLTPQFFVLNQERSIVYRGAWDDNINIGKVKTRYVEDAVTALLNGKQPPVTETKARGCLISYKK